MGMAVVQIGQVGVGMLHGGMMVAMAVPRSGAQALVNVTMVSVVVAMFMVVHLSAVRMRMAVLLAE